MRCWIVLLNNATEVYVEVIVETGERFRSSALPRLPNRLESLRVLEDLGSAGHPFHAFNRFDRLSGCQSRPDR